MRKAANTRWMVTALVAAAIAAPSAHAGTQDDGGEYSSGGPAYGVQAPLPELSAGGPAFGVAAAPGTAELSPGRPLPLESLALVRAAQPTQPAPAAAEGFDWADAGVGAGVGIVAMLLAAAGAGLVRSGRRLAHS